MAPPVPGSNLISHPPDEEYLDKPHLLPVAALSFERAFADAAE
jgi:hypothetical protein